MSYSILKLVVGNVFIVVMFPGPKATGISAKSSKITIAQDAIEFKLLLQFCIKTHTVFTVTLEHTTMTLNHLPRWKRMEEEK